MNKIYNMRKCVHGLNDQNLRSRCNLPKKNEAKKIVHQTLANVAEGDWIYFMSSDWELLIEDEPGFCSHHS